ncbi:FecR domain-containing protein [Pseudomonas sp. ABC1]|uniref:FecR family protein n=1 Tax=Pseudomonas sp. ABC1 TaxID=2748080 RepID=UPI0015C2ED36|nr:FecR domain-containing protein [Pseudomonas sp. ABC1]QLF93845.1 FecR domain-containing protein [Pseudomonas sp. ABC1]
MPDTNDRQPSASRSAPGAGEDRLAPFDAALREHFPSRDALLAEARAQSARQRRRVRQGGTGLLALALASGIWIVDPAWHSEDVQTSVGQRLTRQLADGSQVVLNSTTHLRIERRLRSRQFELVEGEATFTVEHDGPPFIVRSQGVRVLDIGTVFNLRSDRRGVAVSVLEGEVEVSNDLATPRRLLAGQQVQATAERLESTRPVRPAEALAWQQGKLRFDGTPLRDVIVELQRYRQAPIRLGSAHIGDLRLSGEYDTDAVESLIELLPSILPVTLLRSFDGRVVVSGS